MRNSLTLTIASLLAAAPALATGERTASGVPRLSIAGAIPSTPLIKTPAAADLLLAPAAPAAASAEAALALPPAAISVHDAARLIDAEQRGGQAEMERELGRITGSIQGVTQAAEQGAGASYAAGAALEASMTGERIAGSGDAAAAPVSDEASLTAKVKAAQSVMRRVIEEVSRVIVGQEEMKKGTLIALIARQHVLLEGLPGTGKTMLARAFADAVEGHTERVQGTPDKLPQDIIGTEALVEEENTGKRHFELLQGPIFADILLMDEINRMPPKTQSALLEAMAEGHVTVGRRKIPLKRFTVIATQNPKEQEGTFRLPEAQLDRFMLKMSIMQPTAEQMERIVDMNRAKEERPRANKVTTLDQLDEIRRLAEKLPIKVEVKRHAIKLAMSAYEKMQEEEAKKKAQDPDYKPTIDYSVYVRASIDLVTAASLNAVLNGHDYVSMADVDEMAVPILAHRIAMAYGAETTSEEFVKQTVFTLSKTSK